MSSRKAKKKPLAEINVVPYIDVVLVLLVVFMITAPAKPLKEITETIAKVLRQKPKTPVLVWGDTKTEYGLVVSLMSELQGAGAPSVGLVTEPPSGR